MLCRREGAAFSDALAVSGTVRADGHAVLHLHPQVLPDKVHGSLDGQPGIPFAAPGATHLADAVQGPGGHLIAQSPGLPGQGRGCRGDGQELPRADPRPAGAPEAAGPAGDSFAPAVHLPESALQVQLAPGIFIGGEQRRSHHHMVLWPVHMAEGQVHHPAEDSGGVGGSLRQAQAEDGVHALGMAVIANIMAVDAPGLAGFLFMADGALHVLVPDQIFQRCLADQAFFWMQIDHSSLIRSAGSHAAAQSRRPPQYAVGKCSFS